MSDTFKWSKDNGDKLKKLLFDVYRDEFKYGSPKIARRFASDVRHKDSLARPFSEGTVNSILYGNSEFSILRLDTMLKAVGVEEGVKAVM